MLIQIDQIKVGKRLREVDPAKVQSLAESIKEVGLINPIQVSSDYYLVSGAHRLEAMKILKRDIIECIVLQNPALNWINQLIEIDENLIRNNLHYMDEVRFTSRRKEIYEFLHPETKAENNHIKATLSKQRKEEVIRGRIPSSDNSTESFVKDTSEKTGKSKTAIKELISLDKIDPELDHFIKEKDIPKQEAIKIAKMEPSQQKAVIKKIENGEAKKATEALNQIHHENQLEIFKNTPEVKESLVTILEGDFFDKIKEIKDKSIDLLFVDPPYGILKVAWDDKTLEDLRSFTEQWLVAIFPKLKSTARVYICFSTWYEYEIHKLLEKHHYFDFICRQKIIWYYKNNNKPSNRHEYRYSYEPIFYLYGKDAPELNFPPETYGEIQTNVWEIATPQSNFNEGKYHESQKPEELLRRIILTGSKPNDLVFDPFAGSCTTGVLCEQLKRRCILIEQNKEYCEIGRGRINFGMDRKRV